MKVLFVDDEKGLLEQAEIFLERMVDELILDTVISAEIAVEKLDGNTYDAVVSDFQMPRMDGLDLLETIREKKGMDIPFIIFTGKGREEVAIEALNLGANRYLQKGGDPRSQYSLLADAIQQEIELHRTKMHLEARKKQFERAVKLAPYPAMLHAEDGEIILINDAWTDITGYEKDEIPKINEWTEKAYGDEKDSVKDHIEKLFEIEGRVSEGTYTITTKSGDRRKWDFSSSTLGALPDGRRIILSMANDITEREKIEDDLRESERFLDSVLESVQDGISVLDKDLNIQFVNSVMREWYSDNTPLEGKKCYACYQNREGPCEPCPSLKAIESGKTESVIVHGLPGSDAEWLELFSYPIKYPDSDDITGVVEFVRDITDRKRSEERIKHLNSLLKSIRNVNQIIVQGDDLKEIMQEACDSLLNTRSYLEITIALLDQETGKISPVAESGEHTFIKDWEISPDGEGEAPSCVMDVLESGELEVVDSNECEICEYKDDKNSHISVIVPMKTNDQIFGILHVGFKRGVKVGEEEKELLEEVADDLSFARDKLLSEKELRDTKQRLELAVEGSELGVWDWNLKTDEVQFNDKWADMLGYTLEEIDNDLSTWEDKVHEDDLPEVKEALEKHLRGETDIYQTEHRMRTKSGDYKWIKDVGRVFERDENGDPVRAVGIHEDINERKRTEKKLRESEKKYHAITEKSHDAIFVIGRDNLIFVNDRVRELTGYSKEELYDMKWWELLHPDDRGKVKDIDTKGRMGQDVPTKYEAKILTKDGEVKYGDFRVTAIEYEGRLAVLGTIRDITERKEKEEELQEERNFLEQIAETSPVCITKVDKNGKIVYANDRAEDVLGLSKSEINEMTYHDVKWKITDYEGNEFPEEELPFNRVREKKRTVYDVRHAIEWPDGERKFLSINASPIFDDGEFDGMVATIEDITEKVRKERELKESRRRLKTLMNNIPGMAYRCLNDKDWTMKFLSEGCYELTGYHPEELSEGGHISYAEVIHPEHRDDVREKVQEAVEADEPFKIEYKIVTASGETKWVWEKGRRVISDDQEYLEGIITDITGQKEKETELEKGKRRFETLFEENPEAIVEVDEEFKVVKMNSQFERLFKYDGEDIIGEYLDDLVVPEDMMEEADDLNKKSAQKGYFDHETVRIDRYGDEVPVSITGRPIKHDGEKHHLAVYRDIRDRKEAEEREDFLHSLLRHDVRNKTQLAKGYMELMEEEYRNEDEQGYLKKAERAVREAEEIIDKVSKLRKVEKEEEIEEVEIDSVLDKVLSKYHGQLQDNGIDIDVQKCGCIVKAGTLLEELFSNLVENSIRHSHCDKIRISTCSEGDKCIVVVEDDGVGIPESSRDKIFDKGFREGETGGSGLGMYMVKEIAENYSGYVEVKGSELGGAGFEVGLKKV